MFAYNAVVISAHLYTAEIWTLDDIWNSVKIFIGFVFEVSWTYVGKTNFGKLERAKSDKHWRHRHNKTKKITFDAVDIWCELMTTGYQTKIFYSQLKEDLGKEEVKRDSTTF